jgi:hypothetical protein
MTINALQEVSKWYISDFGLLLTSFQALIEINTYAHKKVRGSDPPVTALDSL